MDISYQLRENVLLSKNIRNFFLRVNGAGSDDEVNNIEEVENELSFRLSRIKPGPLSTKVAVLNQQMRSDVLAGRLETLDMPTVNLEFKWEAGNSIDPILRRYLRALQPQKLTTEWIDFALSPLQFKKSQEDVVESKDFSFQMPYSTKNQVIVKRSEPMNEMNINKDLEQMHYSSFKYEKDLECAETEMVWTFDKNVSKSDKLGCEVAETIKDLSNSVFLNLNDDLYSLPDDFEESNVEKFVEKKKDMVVDAKQKKIKCPTKMM